MTIQKNKERKRIKREDAINAIINEVKKEGEIIRTKYYWYDVREDGSVKLDTMHGLYPFVITESGAIHSDDIVWDYLYMFDEFGEFIFSRPFMKGVFEQYAKRFAKEYEIEVEEVTYNDVIKEYRSEIYDELDAHYIDVANDYIKTAFEEATWEGMSDEELQLMYEFIVEEPCEIIDDEDE